MTLTLLQIIQEVCRRQGLTTPQIVVASQDDTLLQLMGLLNEVCEDIVRRKNWTATQYEAVFTSVAGSDQGLVSTHAPNSLRKIVNETIFDRTTGLPLFGPRKATEWQAAKAGVFTGPFYQYRIRDGHIYTLPDMPDGHTLAFEYLSDALVSDPETVPATTKAYFTKDTDVFLLNGAIATLGLRWRWREEKGLPYAEVQRLYESVLAEELGGDGTAATLHMDGEGGKFVPGVFVPSGNWNV